MKCVAIAFAVILAASAAQGQERFSPLTSEAMSPEQKAIAGAIIASRGSMNGPFNAWLRNPVLADRLQKVGEQIRFHSSLPPALNEFAILITARHWTAQFEWYAHYPLAMKAGLTEVAQLLHDAGAAEELTEEEALAAACARADFAEARRIQAGSPDLPGSLPVDRFRVLPDAVAWAGGPTKTAPRKIGSGASRQDPAAYPAE